MSDSPIPGLIDGMVAAAKADPYFKADPDADFDGRLVFDGPENTDDPGDFLMVGVEDPDLRDAANSAEISEDWHGVGMDGNREVDGTIICAALSWNGTGDLKLARDTAYGMRNALARLCLGGDGSGGTFDVETVMWTSPGTQEYLNQAQDEKGALALVVFRINFRAIL